MYKETNKKERFKMKTIKEVADIFQVSEITIRRWIESGRLKAIQAVEKGAIRISEEEIERLKKGE